MGYFKRLITSSSVSLEAFKMYYVMRALIILWIYLEGMVRILTLSKQISILTLIFGSTPDSNSDVIISTSHAFTASVRIFS